MVCVVVIVDITMGSISIRNIRIIVSIIIVS